MKIPTQHRRSDAAPTISPLSTDRIVWWIMLFQVALLITVPMVVFAYAGGTSDQVSSWFNTAIDAPTRGQTLALLAAPPKPFGLALLSAFGMLLADALGDAAARRSERRHFHRWYAARRLEDVPGEPATTPAEEEVAAR